MARRATPALFERMQACFRAARFRQVEALIEALVQQHGEIRVLDAAGRAEYWNMLYSGITANALRSILSYREEPRHFTLIP